MSRPKPKRSFRAAIDAHCRDCTYDPKAGGTWRQQVEGCGITSCALYELRPQSRPRASR